MTPITKIEAPGEKIQGIIYDKLMPALDGEEIGHSVIALLSLSVIVMKPDISLEALQTIINDVSQRIILHLDAPEEGDKEEWN